MRRPKKPEDIRGVVNKVLSRIERQGPGKKEKISEAWHGTVGEKASLHSRPVGIKRKILLIEVDSSTWFYGLSLKKTGILKDINKRLTEYKIEDIRFRMGDIT